MGDYILADQLHCICFALFRIEQFKPDFGSRFAANHICPVFETRVIGGGAAIDLQNQEAGGQVCARCGTVGNDLLYFCRVVFRFEQDAHTNEVFLGVNRADDKGGECDGGYSFGFHVASRTKLSHSGPVLSIPRGVLVRSSRSAAVSQTSRSNLTFSIAVRISRRPELTRFCGWPFCPHTAALRQWAYQIFARSSGARQTGSPALMPNAS